ERSETALPKKTRPFFATIDPSRVTQMRGAHRFREAFGRRRRRDDMDVVRHEAVRPRLDAGTVETLCRDAQIGEIIRVAEESPLRPIPRLDDMVGNRRDNAPRSPRHRRTPI